MKYGWIFRGKKNSLLRNAAIALKFVNTSVYNYDRHC